MTDELNNLDKELDSMFSWVQKISKKNMKKSTQSNIEKKENKRVITTNSWKKINSRNNNYWNTRQIEYREKFISKFPDTKFYLPSLREGYTIALINIKPLKDKDIVELKRVVNKLKKTCDAIEGDIAGFGEDWIVVTPSFAHVYRTTETEEVKD